MTDQTTEAILDATRSSVLDFGIRRTTLTDIARRAGVSRMTVYRRYPDVDAILRDLMTRQFGGAMADIARHVDDEQGRARLVGRIVAGVRTLRADALMTKVMEAEPELLLPYVVGRMGETQRAAVELVMADVRAGQADGSIRDGDPRLITQGLLLVTQSFVFSAGIAEDVGEPALLEELARLLDRALVP